VGKSISYNKTRNAAALYKILEFRSSPYLSFSSLRQTKGVYFFKLLPQLMGTILIKMEIIYIYVCDYLPDVSWAGIFEAVADQYANNKFMRSATDGI